MAVDTIDSVITIGVVVTSIAFVIATVRRRNGHQSGVISMVGPIGSLFTCPQLEILFEGLFIERERERDGDCDDFDKLYSPLGHSKETDSMAAAT